jgi:hypothetical protein
MRPGRRVPALLERRDLTLPPSRLGRFHALLQRGVAMRIAAPRSALQFLTEDLGLDPRYVEERISTVFLDGAVVDALGAASLRAGSLLALSAAMPGLVGATLRRAGRYAAMRAEITSARGLAPAGGGTANALVHVKLFNLLLDEIGPVVLARGVVLPPDEACGVLCDVDLAPGGPPRGQALELRVRFS